MPFWVVNQPCFELMWSKKCYTTEKKKLLKVVSGSGLVKIKIDAEWIKQ